MVDQISTKALILLSLAALRSIEAALLTNYKFLKWSVSKEKHTHCISCLLDSKINHKKQHI